MTTQQFISKAVEGGWNPRPEKVKPRIVNVFPTEFGNKVVIMSSEFLENGKKNERNFSLVIEQILLDPKSWEAVGKVECGDMALCKEHYAEWAKHHMHQMIDALIDGKSIEDYLLTL